jgi:hypothetical protein
LKQESLADPHCHTTASDGMVSPAELVDGALGAGLSLIAVTDHDTMANAREVQRRGEEAGLGVVAGQEVTTRWPAQTHVLGWFLETPVRSGMTLQDTVEAIHAQGGLAVIPHPFMPTYFASCQPAMLARLIETHSVDGIELMHTAPTGALRRAALERFYELNSERLGAQLGSSDSHYGGFDLGSVVTAYPGAGAEDFRRAVVARRTVPRRGRAIGPPVAMRMRQQLRSLVQLPLRRLSGRQR